jgi:hypothetical protein
MPMIRLIIRAMVSVVHSVAALSDFDQFSPPWPKA